MIRPNFWEGGGSSKPFLLVAVSLWHVMPGSKYIPDEDVELDFRDVFPNHDVRQCEGGVSGMQSSYGAARPTECDGKTAGDPQILWQGCWNIGTI